MLYNNSYDDTYLVTRFVTGLREDIRSVIVLHRSKDVDTASALALIQEEELAQAKSRPGKEFLRNTWKTSMEKSKTGDGEKAKLNSQKPDDKLSALREHRRENGLCFKCGGKWGKTHKCPPNVPIHVVEELLDALQTDDLSVDDVSMDSTEEVDETLLAVGHAAVAGNCKRKTLKLCGKVGKTDILILVDSGSVGTFISQQLAAQIPYKLVQCQVSHFVAADGGPMTCSRKIENLQWTA